MSKEAWEDEYEMEPEYDFSNSVRNPYAARFREGANRLCWMRMCWLRFQIRSL